MQSNHLLEVNTSSCNPIRVHNIVDNLIERLQQLKSVPQRIILLKSLRNSLLPDYRHYRDRARDVENQLQEQAKFDKKQLSRKVPVTPIPPLSSSSSKSIQVNRSLLLRHEHFPRDIYTQNKSSEMHKHQKQQNPIPILSVSAWEGTTYKRQLLSSLVVKLWKKVGFLAVQLNYRWKKSIIELTVTMERSERKWLVQLVFALLRQEVALAFSIDKRSQRIAQQYLTHKVYRPSLTRWYGYSTMRRRLCSLLLRFFDLLKAKRLDLAVRSLIFNRHERLRRRCHSLVSSNFPKQYSLYYSWIAWLGAFIRRQQIRMSLIQSYQRGQGRSSMLSPHPTQSITLLDLARLSNQALLSICREHFQSLQVAVRRALSQSRCLDVKLTRNRNQWPELRAKLVNNRGNPSSIHKELNQMFLSSLKAKVLLPQDRFKLSIENDDQSKRSTRLSLALNSSPSRDYLSPFLSEMSQPTSPTPSISFMDKLMNLATSPALSWTSSDSVEDGPTRRAQSHGLLPSRRRSHKSMSPDELMDEEVSPCSDPRLIQVTQVFQVQRLLRQSGRFFTRLRSLRRLRQSYCYVHNKYRQNLLKHIWQQIQAIYVKLIQQQQLFVKISRWKCLQRIMKTWTGQTIHSTLHDRYEQYYHYIINHIIYPHSLSRMYRIWRQAYVIKNRMNFIVKRHDYYHRREYFNQWKGKYKHRKQRQMMLYLVQLISLKPMMRVWRFKYHKRSLLRRVFQLGVNAWKYRLIVQNQATDFHLLHNILQAWHRYTCKRASQREAEYQQYQAVSFRHATLLAKCFYPWKDFYYIMRCARLVSKECMNQLLVKTWTQWRLAKQQQDESIRTVMTKQAWTNRHDGFRRWKQLFHHYHRLLPRQVGDYLSLKWSWKCWRLTLGYQWVQSSQAVRQRYRLLSKYLFLWWKFFVRCQLLTVKAKKVTIRNRWHKLKNSWQHWRNLWTHNRYCPKVRPDVEKVDNGIVAEVEGGRRVTWADDSATTKLLSSRPSNEQKLHQSSKHDPSHATETFQTFQPALSPLDDELDDELVPASIDGRPFKPRNYPLKPKHISSTSHRKQSTKAIQPPSPVIICSSSSSLPLHQLSSVPSVESMDQKNDEFTNRTTGYSHLYRNSGPLNLPYRSFMASYVPTLLQRAWMFGYMSQCPSLEDINDLYQQLNSCLKGWRKAAMYSQSLRKKSLVIRSRIRRYTLERFLRSWMRGTPKLAHRLITWWNQWHDKTNRRRSW